MKKLLIIPVLFLTVMFGSPSFSADLQKGLNAARSRDFATALREWSPLAEQGNVFAQNNLKKLQKKIAKSGNTPPVVTARKSSPPSSSSSDNELARLRREILRLRTQNQSKPKPGSTGSGFFVSKLGYIITNEHVVRRCSSITVGDSAKKQVKVTLVDTDKRNDLALLKISNTQMASVETKSLIQKLGLKMVPTASEGLLRSDDLELGEKVLVAGFPYGELFSNTIKVTGGMVSANKGMGDDSGQFEIDVAAQPRNSGGPNL